MKTTVRRGGDDLERLYLEDTVVKSRESVVVVKRTRFRAGVDRGDVVMRHLARYGLVLPFIRPDTRVLDAPCGSGIALEVFSVLARNGRFSYEGVDLDGPTIEYARATYQRFRGWAKFLVGDLRSLQLAHGAYDAIACIEGIEHVDAPSQHRAIGEFSKALRRGGVLVVSSPVAESRTSGPSRGNPYHVHELTRQGFGALLETGFKRRNISVMAQRNVLSTGRKAEILYGFCTK